MTTLSRILGLTLLAAGITAAATSASLAQDVSDYPNKPIRLIIGSAPGNSHDSLARAIGEGLKAKVGQGFQVENKPGAGQILAAMELKKAEPDGYTFGWFTSNAILLNPLLYKNLPYDPTKDFIPVTQHVAAHTVMVVQGSLGVNTFEELIAYSKAHPNELNQASGGVGADSHLVWEWLKKEYGGNWTHIPYQSTSDLLLDFAGGKVHMFQLVIGNGDTLDRIKDGRAKALLVMGDDRSPLLPDVPTYKEAGIPLRTPLWLGFFAPAGTPKPVLEKFQQMVKEIVFEPTFVEKYVTPYGFHPVGSTPDEFASFLPEQHSTVKELLEIAGAIGLLEVK